MENNEHTQHSGSVRDAAYLMILAMGADPLEVSQAVWAAACHEARGALDAGGDFATWARMGGYMSTQRIARVYARVEAEGHAVGSDAFWLACIEIGGAA